MISIYGEIRAIETGEADREDNVLKWSPHTAQDLLADIWDRSYSRESAAYPAPGRANTSFGRLSDASITFMATGTSSAAASQSRKQSCLTGWSPQVESAELPV